MGKSTVHVDLKDLKSFAKFLNSGANTKEIIRKSVNELGQQHLANVIKRTPVDNGKLRESWKAEVKEIVDGYEATVSTNVLYAPYVNYGHRQEVGRFVKAIGKRLKQPWVEGSFFIQRAEAQTVKSIEKVVAKHLKKWMEKNGK